MMKTFRNTLLALALITVAIAGSARADKIVKNDGTVLEGQITQDAETYIFIKVKIGGVDRVKIVPKSEIASIERDAEQPAGEVRVDRNLPARSSARDVATRSTSEGATKVSFISLEGEVGMSMNANALLRAVEELEDDEPEVLVLTINSGGGFLREVEPLSDAIHEELKGKYRVVAWIESAISAACMTAWNCEEIYMRSQGALGGNVAYRMDANGNTEALQGDELELVLLVGRQISARGKRDPLIMQAMQKFSPLSCDIDDHNNKQWFESEQGKHLVNPETRVLTFNSVNASRFGVSRGTADTKEELMRAMGIKEWVEVGTDAEAHMVKFRKNVDALGRRLNLLWAEYQQGLELAQAGSERLRERGIGQARSRLQQIRAGVKRAPSFEEYTIFTPEWFAEREKELRELARDRR